MNIPELNRTVINFCILVLLIAGLTLIQSCKKTDCPQCQEETEFKTFLDSIYGIWSWCGTYDYRSGMVDPDFASTIYFTPMNSDSTMSYETYKTDTLKKSGICTVKQGRWTKKIKPNILLHFNVTNENLIDFITVDTIKFYEDVTDNLEYYYVKISQ